MPRHGNPDNPINEALDPKLTEELNRWAKNTGLEAKDITPQSEVEERQRIENTEVQTRPYDESDTPSEVETVDNFRDIDIAERLAKYPEDLSDVKPEEHPEDAELLRFAKARQAIREAEIPGEGFLGMNSEHHEAVRNLIKLAEIDKYTLGSFYKETINRLEYLIGRLKLSVEAHEEKPKDLARYYRSLLAEELLNKLKEYKEKR